MGGGPLTLLPILCFCSLRNNYIIAEKSFFVKDLLGATKDMVLLWRGEGRLLFKS